MIVKEKSYDLEKNPHEVNNLINNPTYNSISTELKQNLFDWMIETNDPILKGKVPFQLNSNFKYKE